MRARYLILTKKERLAALFEGGRDIRREGRGEEDRISLKELLLYLMIVMLPQVTDYAT